MSSDGMGTPVRRRASLACDVCRSRRTKCDGAKPTCSFCSVHGLDCVYRTVAAPAHSKHEREIISIRERLDYISGVLSIRPRDPHSVFSEEPERISTNNVTGVGDYPLDESIISRKWRNEFPFMTIQTPSMMCFLGLPPRFAAQLVVAERETSSMLIQPGLSLNVEIHEEQSIGAFRAHCYKIHHWYPILHPTFFNTYLEMTKGLLPQSTDLFLSLVTAAIGSVVQCRSFREVQETRPDTIYIERALSILPVVNMEFSLRSVQCLVMLTIYYNCIMKPCQAHDYILMASFKAQGLFKCHFYPDDDINQNLLRRCFWSILMIETDLAYHIDMPESNAWKFDDRILLPEIFESWQPYREYEHHQLDDLRLNENTTKAYFLAAIAMCRMIRRCTTAITISHDKEVYASVIAHELARQLDTWYDRLPESLRFDRTIDQGAQNTAVLSPSSEIPGLTTATKSLKMQYYLCLTGIFWPAVYSAVYVDNIGSEALADCARYFDAYASFVVSAVEALHNYPPSPWSIYASLFITTMAAFQGAHCPNLRGSISHAVLRSFQLVAETFRTCQEVEVSPSLSRMQMVLVDRIGNQL